MKLLCFFLLSISLIGTSCKSKKKSQETVAVSQEYSSNHPDSLFFSMRKSACLGQCPVYKLYVNHSGEAKLEGRDFIEFKGHFNGQFSQADLDSIKKSILLMDYFSMEKEYDAMITDVPATVTEFHLNDQHHQIRNRWDGPDELKALQKYIHKVVLNTEWTKDSE